MNKRTEKAAEGCKLITDAWSFERKCLKFFEDEEELCKHMFLCYPILPMPVSESLKYGDNHGFILIIRLTHWPRCSWRSLKSLRHFYQTFGKVLTPSALWKKKQRQIYFGSLDLKP